MYNQTAVKSITTYITTSITTEDNTMNTFDQMLHDSINLECDMVGMDVDSELYLQLERKLGMLNKAIEIEIGQLQERESLSSLKEQADAKYDQMVETYHDGDKLEYDLLNDELIALEAQIVDMEEAELDAELDAEQAKMDRDVQEFQNSLINVPF
tara:strand:- start:1506 stop:1970 length:465 start_codon:yes stop_codon:yes gene_type:complete